MVNIKINDVPLQVEEGLTVLQACRQLNIDIPTLCYVPMHLANEKNNNASCRVCVVEIKGSYLLLVQLFVLKEWKFILTPKELLWREELSSN